MCKVSGKVLKTEVKDRSNIRPFQLNKVDDGTARKASAGQEEPNSDVMQDVRDAAYNSGLEDGLNKGRMMILKEIGTELKIMKGLIEGAEKLKDELYRKIENDVVDISVMIARKIIGAAVEQDRELVVNIAKEAIKRASDREVLRIRVAPVDYDTLNKKRSELLQCIDGIKSLIFEADESVQPGGCLIETNQGDIDARIDSQIKVIKGALTAAK
ncbi:MAG: hypothetical protein IT393_10080 [Nitrospirae bacterium]|nr:hypothetical protein [Nitrospirota bacterium]